MTRRFPWILATVPWSDAAQFTRGTHEGLPLLSYGCAPRDKLATFRQLRAMGLRPNGQDPVAVLYVRHRASGKTTFASLYLIETAAPVRPMTLARQSALDKAMLARRTCRDCGQVKSYRVPTSTQTCWTCWGTTEIQGEAVA